MSKSEVNLSKHFHMPKRKSETALPSLKESMYTGKHLNYQRCYGKDESYDGAKFKAKKVKPTNLYICKLVFPQENIYPTCDHQNDFVVDRSTFTRDEYIKFLASPKKFYEKPHPRWVRKNIPPCTAHLNELSQPKKLNLISTLNEHRHHFTFNQVENFIQKIHFGDHQTPQEVMQSLRQQLRDSRFKIKHQKCVIKRLKLKIAKSKQFENLSAHLMAKLRQNVLCDRPMNMTQESQKLTDLILPKICEITGHKVPCRNSTNSTDRAHIKLARNFAICVYDYLRNNCLKSQLDEMDESECLKRFQQLCLPIDSYYPQELPKVVSRADMTDGHERDEAMSQDEASDREEMMHAEIMDAASDELMPKLSFLRPSQVKIPIEDCQNLMGALDSRDEQLAAKKAQKELQRQERAENERKYLEAKAAAEAERLAQEKAERAARRRARKRRGRAGCFGNLNPKPVWQVQWKDDEESELCKPSTTSNLP